MRTGLLSVLISAYFVVVKSFSLDNNLGDLSMMLSIMAALGCGLAIFQDLKEIKGK